MPLQACFRVYRNEGLGALLRAILDTVLLRLGGPRLFWLGHGKVLRSRGEDWVITDVVGDGEFHVPDPDCVGYTPRGLHHLESRYFDGPVALEEGDVVFDVGAFVGKTAILAAENADHVYAIEPSPRNRRCLQRNVADYDNIEVLPYVAYDESGEVELHLGTQPDDDGIFNPDEGAAGVTTARAKTVADIADSVDVDTIDFLKVEAEGSEPEVVAGIDSVPVKKIVSTGDAERDGETVYESVAAILRANGYTVTVDNSDKYNMVYATSTET